MPNCRGKAAALHPRFPIPWLESYPHFFPTLHPRATLMSLPLPDGTRTCWTRWEEGLSGFAVTCGGHREEAEAIGVPLAGGQGDRAKPATGPGFVARQPKGGMRGGRSVRACGGHEGRLAFRVRAGTLPEPLPRSVQTAAGAIRAGINSRGCEAPSVGCGHHPAIFGPRACCATDLSVFRKAKPACGPPDQIFLITPIGNTPCGGIAMFAVNWSVYKMRTLSGQNDIFYERG
ncbi:hypothetical protein IMCC20628_01538 [Hoeflea sp. IMCC20628]|nr:hypothetical protein IMCC20628_01538 [Hoeflea sp. IMCC20628]